MITLLSKEELDKCYPIGAIYYSDGTNPTCIVGGVWENFNDCKYCFIRIE